MKGITRSSKAAKKAAFADMGITARSFYKLEKLVRATPKEKTVHVEVI